MAKKEMKPTAKQVQSRREQIGSGINKTLMDGAIKKGREINKAKVAEMLRKKK